VQQISGSTSIPICPFQTSDEVLAPLVIWQGEGEKARPGRGKRKGGRGKRGTEVPTDPSPARNA